jgi:hypothetical protein
MAYSAVHSYCLRSQIMSQLCSKIMYLNDLSLTKWVKLSSPLLLTRQICLGISVVDSLFHALSSYMWALFSSLTHFLCDFISEIHAQHI